MKPTPATLLLLLAALSVPFLTDADAISRLKGIGPGSQVNWGTGTGLLYVEKGIAYVANCVGCVVTTSPAGAKTITIPALGVTLPIPIQSAVTVPDNAGIVEQFSFEIGAVPVPNTLAVFRNGALQREGDDFSISGTTITLLHSKCDIGTSVGGCWWTPEDQVRVMYLRLP